MKKISKLQKALVLSGMAVLAFGSIAVGSTYALFTNKAETNITVSTGKVLIEKTVTLEGGKTLKNTDEAVNADVANGVVKFGAGGTAKINGDNVVLDRIVSGDEVTVKVHVENKSTVDIKYRAVITADAKFAGVIDLTGKADGKDMSVTENGECFTMFATATPEQTSLGDYTLTIGIDKDTNITDGKETSGNVNITIEAIQGNAKKDDMVAYHPVKDATDLVETINNAEDNAVVDVVKPVELDDTLTVDLADETKSVNLRLSENVTVPEGKTAFTVTKGTLELDGNAVTTQTSGQQVKFALAKTKDTLPEIRTKGKDAKGDKVTTVKAVGEGSKVIIDGVKIVSEDNGAIAAVDHGEVYVKYAEVESVEYAAMAFNYGKLTIDGGIFNTSDNFVVGTNGTKDAIKDLGHNTITINGGTFNSQIKTSGYIACGVYVANSDTVNINGGTFNITDGCGVVARSGKTTVSDKVEFNFSNTKGRNLTVGGVGDKSCNLPVNARIVKDLSKPEYPAGAPVVDGKGVVDILKTDGKAYLVSSEEELTKAVNEGVVTDSDGKITGSENNTKYIYLLNDITLTDKVEIRSKNTVIYGNDDTKLQVTSAGKRVIALYGDDYPFINGGSFSLVGVDARIVSENQTTGEITGTDVKSDCNTILTYALSDFKLTLDNVSLAAKYPLDIGKLCDGVTVSARYLDAEGYCAFQTYGNNTTATFENCDLVGRNQYGGDADCFSTIAMLSDTKNTNLTFKSTKITAIKEDKADEHFLCARTGATGNAYFDKNCTLIYTNTSEYEPGEDYTDNIHINSGSTFTYTIEQQ